MKTQNSILNENDLLQSFTQQDVEKAKANLLQRYQMWQGLLISNDQKSVITPDDLEHFRVQASDLLEQPLKSDYELEQLKILTVLIYLLIDADKAALPAGDPHIHAQLDELQLPHAHDYIVRKIIHNTSELDMEDIERLVEYENWVLSSYITQVPPESDWQPGTLTGLCSRDGTHFTLTDKSYEINVERVDTPEAAPAPQITPVTKPRVTPKAGEYEPLVLCDEQSKSLIDTFQYSQLNCGVEVSAASYVGMYREHNEDAIVIQPEHNHVVVIDAMGGYSNGVEARDVFVDALFKYPDNIETAVNWTQNRYDALDIVQGGVCLISIKVHDEQENLLIEFAQAGDVHAALYDDKGQVRHETIDEAIGHQVINAVIGRNATISQQANGWKNFGKLTCAKLHAKPGWRLAVYSDGVANHFNANQLAPMILDKSPKEAIADISKAVDEAMHKDRAYRDNTSVAILDF
jgi:serine/threonine protein phosphatase PrpC